MIEQNDPAYWNSASREQRERIVSQAVWHVEREPVNWCIPLIALGVIMFWTLLGGIVIHYAG